MFIIVVENTSEHAEAGHYVELKMDFDTSMVIIKKLERGGDGRNTNHMAVCYCEYAQCWIQAVESASSSYHLVRCHEGLEECSK